MGYREGSFTLIEGRRAYKGLSALIKASALYAAIDFAIGNSVAGAVGSGLIAEMLEFSGALIVTGLTRRKN